MAVCNLADLEEIEATRITPSLEELFEKAIEIAELEYDGCHVYPYTYYGGYLFRKGLYSKATICWKNAALVVARYVKNHEFLCYSTLVIQCVQEKNILKKETC